MAFSWIPRGEIKPSAENVVIDLIDQWVFPSIWHGNAGNPPATSTTVNYTAAAATGEATNTATPSRTRAYTSGGATGTATNSASIGRTRAYTGATDGTASNTATFGYRHSYTGAADGTATNAATIEIHRVTTYTTSATGETTTSAAISIAAVLAATADGTATNSATIRRTRAYTGTADGTATNAATIELTRLIDLSAAATGDTTIATASLLRLRGATLATTGTATNSATLRRTRAYTAGSATGTSTAAAVNRTPILYKGSALGTSTAAGALTRWLRHNFTGRATGAATAASTGLTNPTAPPGPFYGAPIVPVADTRRPAHLMAIGPAIGGYRWRGAPNYGIDPIASTNPIVSVGPVSENPIFRATALRANRTRAVEANEGIILPSRPTLALPTAQSKSFTLRLDGPAEARADHVMDRKEALVIEQMATDLWWRRRTPTGGVETIGRFNADKVDISSNESGAGVRISATWTDYRGLLEQRLVLKYLDVPNQESTWPAGIPITNVLEFALPTNTGIDLSEAAGPTPVDLGDLREPFELPPGTSIADLMDNLEAVSTKTWDWWVQMPTDDTLPPKLRFAPGGRGSDKGVVLLDIGTGQTAIESWTMQNSGDTYANTLFFSGAEGGVVEQFGADVEIYGQRDATAQDSSITAKKLTVEQNRAVIRRAALRKLRELADRTPTWQLNLRPGFWQGRDHIDLGDWVTIYIELGNERLAGKHRVTEITCDIDASGTERVAVTVGRPRPSKDPRSRRSTLSRLVRTLKAYERKGT